MKWPFRWGPKPKSQWDGAPGWCMEMGWTDRPPCNATCCANRLR